MVGESKTLLSRPYASTVVLGVLTLLVVIWRFAVIPQLGITLYIDEAQYWTWAQDLDWGYFSKPPGIAVLIAASTALFGDGLLGVKALSMLCYPATAWLTWAIARCQFDDRTAFWSALAVMTLPIFSWLSLFVSTDALLSLFWMGALLAYLGAIRTNAWTNWLLVGILCGLGLMSKYTMVVWMLAALTHLFVYHRALLRGPKPWLAALLALAILSPNLIWNVAHDFPTLKHTADITISKHAAGGFKSLSTFLAAQWAAFGPIYGSLFLIVLWGIRSAWKDERQRTLLWFALPLWLLVSAQAFKTSANANWAAPAFAPAAILVVVWLLQRGHRKLLIAGLALNLTLVGAIYHWPQLLTLSGHANSRVDPFARARGWDALAHQLQPILADHPGAVLVAENRTLLAHLAYELRQQHPAYASWNPKGQGHDHYQLTTDLLAYRGHDLVFVTQDKLPALPAGQAAQGPTLLSTPINRDRALELNVYVLPNFQGY